MFVEHLFSVKLDGGIQRNETASLSSRSLKYVGGN